MKITEKEIELVIKAAKEIVRLLVAITILVRETKKMKRDKLS